MRDGKTLNGRRRRACAVLVILAVTTFITAIHVMSSYASEKDRVPDIDKGKSCSLTVRMEKGAEKISGAGIEVIKTADLTTGGGAANYTTVPDFADLKIEYEGMTAERSISEAARLSKAADAKGINGSKIITGKNGEALFSGLDPGIYLVRQYSRSGTADKYDLIKPYLVMVPGIDAKDTGNEWIYDVISLPKPGITSNPGIIERDPPVRKIVKGNPRTEGKFIFRLTAEDINNPMPSGSKAGVKEISRKGAGVSEFGSWKYTEAGVYRYTVTETDTGEKGYTYDKTRYTLTDIVKYRSGKLVLETTITDGKGNIVPSLCFTNSYSYIGIVKTGDANNILPWLAVSALCIITAATLIIRRRADS